jgi:hypothetical protein
LGEINLPEIFMSALDSIVSTAPSLPSRVYLHSQEKWGKTSFAAYTPNPIFQMTQGETGLLTLIEAGMVPHTPHFAEDAQNWPDFLKNMRAIRDEQHPHKTLVIDTANGAERLLQKWVCDNEFNGQMSGREGYISYGKGDLACVPHWDNFLRLLDEIRNKRKMAVILLAHNKVKTVNNPEGADYDQLRPEGIEKLWTLTHKWADIIAAGTHRVIVKDDKVTSQRGRILRTSGSVSVVAGNRYGLPAEIECGDSAASTWKAFATAVGKAKQAGKVQNSAPDQGNGSGGQAAPVDQKPTPTQPAQTNQPPKAEAPASKAEPAASAPVERGDSYEGPDERLPAPVMQMLIEQMHEKNITWADVRHKHLVTILGRTVLEDEALWMLTLEESGLLKDWLARLPGKKKRQMQPA